MPILPVPVPAPGSTATAEGPPHADELGEGARNPGCAYSAPYTLRWIPTSFLSFSARCRISGMSGSRPVSCCCPSCAGADAEAEAELRVSAQTDGVVAAGDMDVRFEFDEA